MRPSLPHVVHVEDNLFTCSQDTQGRIGEVIKEKGPQPRGGGGLFAAHPRASVPGNHPGVGLNKYLFDMANIRDQDSWVHRRTRQVPPAKAKDLVRMAVARAALLKPLVERSWKSNSELW